MRLSLLLIATATALALAGCRSPTLPVLAPLDSGAPDLGVVDLAHDFSTETPDLAVPDAALPIDLATGDGEACGGGYLNSDLASACPLACSPAVEAVRDEGALHVAFDLGVAYQHNPPASGNHWPSPAPWGVHPEVVPPEWWVHNLEHQGVVLLYNCPGGDGGAANACPAEIAQLIALRNGHQPDQFNEVRILITPDPTLPGRFAAVAWDWSMVTNSLDPVAYQCFIDARYGRGPEPAP